MTDYTDLKARLGFLTSPEAECMPDGERLTKLCNISRTALAAIEELEARAAKMEAFVRSCIGSKVYVPVEGVFVQMHETGQSQRARAIIAELETPNDRA